MNEWSKIIWVAVFLCETLYDAKQHLQGWEYSIRIYVYIIAIVNRNVLVIEINFLKNPTIVRKYHPRYVSIPFHCSTGIGIWYR